MKITIKGDPFFCAIVKYLLCILKDLEFTEEERGVDIVISKNYTYNDLNVFDFVIFGKVDSTDVLNCFEEFELVGEVKTK